MVVRAALVAREDGEVDGVLEVVQGLLALGIDRPDALAEEDHGAAGATERLVSGGGDDVSVEEGGGDNLGGDKTRNVCHINNEVSANEISNLAHALVVNQTAVGRGTGDKDLGAVKDDVLLKLVVVDDSSVQVDTVGHGLEVGRDSRDPESRSVAVGKGWNYVCVCGWRGQHTCAGASGSRGTGGRHEEGRGPSDDREEA